MFCVCIPACEAAPEAGESESGVAEQALSWGELPPPGPTTTDTPVGISLEIDNGTAQPLKVRQGQRVYINEIDMRASIEATSVDEGVRGLDASGDFASLDWHGTAQADESFLDSPNPDGTFTRRRFFRESNWMEEPSFFLIEQLDGGGHPHGVPMVVGTGLEEQRFPFDSFFIRRLRAIQWTYDCPTFTSCNGASHFSEEALVELRHANGPNPNFTLRGDTTSLRVTWTLKPSHPYTVPVQQVANPTWDYGFGIGLAAVTAPAPDGTYAPGQSVSFQFTMKDGAGKRLHDPGTMPSYADFLAGNVESGIQYYRLGQEQFATYYRRKHRESQVLVAIMGPVQDNRPIRSVVDLAEAIDFSTGVIHAGTQAEDGIYGDATGVPNYLILLGGPAFWSAPVTDTATFTLPSDAAPGTYYVVIKARRKYLGEDTPKSAVLPIQVGTPQVTQPALTTGGCQACHQDGSSLGRVLHGLDNRAACTTCHAPISFELEGPVYVRTHFIHSRSNRFDAPLDKCSSCHLDNASIQRTSKSACLSCHKSYPADHVQNYGPIVDMYVGGREESFQQCSTTCHTTHPNSHLQ